jgi:DNA mismatch endonuclease (patch repair protein)
MGELMADTLTPEQRRRSMANVKAKDTHPEKIVRSLLHRLGYRFRLHRRDLPGKPDIVFPSRRKVIFVNGCFWHMHKCRRGKSAPVTNAGFWRTKRRGTVNRDRRTLRALVADGWDAYIVWECALKDLKALGTQLEAFLRNEE